MENSGTALERAQTKRLSRRSLLGVGAAASAAAVAGLAAPSLVGVASAHGVGRHMTLRVVDAHITANGGLGDPSATFFIVIGNITQVDGEAATGKFYCRGVVTNPAALGLPPLVDGTPDSGGFTSVEQRFRIDGMGSIIGSGDEGDVTGEPLAIIGGTGRFTGAHGTYTGAGAPIPLPGGTGTLDFNFRIRRG